MYKFSIILISIFLAGNFSSSSFAHSNEEKEAIEDNVKVLDILEKQRKFLEAKNEALVKQQIETIRLNKEIQTSRKQKIKVESL